MMAHRLLGLFLLIIVVSALAAQAQNPENKAKQPAKLIDTEKDEEAINQQRLAAQFREFSAALLSMSLRLERSSKPEDRERAALLKQAIRKASEAGIDNKFETLVSLLRANKTISLPEIREAMDRSKLLAEDIRALLAILMSDNRDAQIKAEAERIRKLLEMLDKTIREQKVVRAQTESGLEKGALSKSQEKVTGATKDIAKAMSKDSKDTQGKSEDKSKGKGEDKGKGEGKGEGQGQGEGQGKEEGQPSPKKPGNQQPDQETPGKKQVQDAIGDQKQAEEGIKKDQRDAASNNQDSAIKKLEEARKKLEEILRQLREEERERLLANLQARCERMLALQTEVYEGTVRVDKAVAQTADKRAGHAEEQHSLRLSDREQEIVKLANGCIELLRDEGSAVAFPEVFAQVRDDAQNVARRLNKADVGTVTQAIEQDIIATLKEMIEALKKAQQANKGNPGQSQGQQGNQRLIELLAELKIIRSLQVRVNTRTVTYARQYPGEQAQDADIQRELLNLAGHQQKIFDMTNNIARGKNR